MSDDIRFTKITTRPLFEAQISKFYHVLANSQSSKDEKNTHVKATRRQLRFEKMSGKRGLVVNAPNNLCSQLIGGCTLVDLSKSN